MLTVDLLWQASVMIMKHMIPKGINLPKAITPVLKGVTSFHDTDHPAYGLLSTMEGMNGLQVSYSI